MKSIEQERYAFVKASLRRSSMRWKYKNEAKKLARIERGYYRCAMCEESFGYKEIEMDHISPVIGVKGGFNNWDELITNLLPDASGYQALCHSCHAGKTAIENEMRKEYRKRKKKLDTQLKKK